MTTTRWDRDAVVYQVYVRSFADADADGVGDLAGITSRLDYLAELGVDAIWVTPFYVSPMIDGGYDVADHRDVDPRFGTLADFDELVSQASRRGLKLLVDFVPNHTSSEHPWFVEALRSLPGSAARQRYLFRPGQGTHGELPPNNWRSAFGGPAWKRDGDEWYLHLFAPEQPDLNWDNAEVLAEYTDILRFWCDRGVAGFRIDVAHAIAKPPGLPDAADPTTAVQPYYDVDPVHAVHRAFRKVLDAAHPPAVAFGEVRLTDIEAVARYVRPDELHQAFNFDFFETEWSADAFKQAIDRATAAMGGVGATVTWVLGTHDNVRQATRFAPDDPAAGLRRARAAALLMLALPGSAVLYQGEELGLPEVTDLPADAHDDPIWERESDSPNAPRDGCRVPLPWTGEDAPFGFGTGGSWLPQPASWRDLTAAAQTGDRASTLSMYRHALELRRQIPQDEPLQWLPAPDGVLAFARGDDFVCVINYGKESVSLADVSTGDLTPVVGSGDNVTRAAFGGETAAWWVRGTD